MTFSHLSGKQRESQNINKLQHLFCLVKVALEQTRNRPAHLKGMAAKSENTSNLSVISSKIPNSSGLFPRLRTFSYLGIQHYTHGI